MASIVLMEFQLTLLHPTMTSEFSFMTSLRSMIIPIKVTTKAKRVLGMIKKSFEYLDSDMLSKLFTTLVRPILEYSNAIWGPLFTLDQRKVETVQRRATHLLPSLHEKS